MPVDVIAIDGPAASGKSTIANRVAKRIGAAYVSTGAMYRAVTWKALQLGINLEKPSEKDLAGLLSKLDMRYAHGSDGVFALQVDGKFLDAELRTPEVSSCVSHVAALPNVREAMRLLQRAMAGAGTIVMEGRDIGTCVFPDAKMKFFLTASPLVRAQRRLAQGGEMPEGSDVEAVAREIAARDEMDSKRPIAPLKQADDAILIDSSDLEIEETLGKMLAEITRKSSDPKGGARTASAGPRA
jgi:CMP/dCMP kinase